MKYAFLSSNVHNPVKLQNNNHESIKPETQQINKHPQEKKTLTKQMKPKSIKHSIATTKLRISRESKVTNKGRRIKETHEKGVFLRESRHLPEADLGGERRETP